MTDTFADLLPTLSRIADALERMAPPARQQNDLSVADAFVWHAETGYLQPVKQVNRVDIGLLQGIEQQKRILYNNTKRFADGLPANNALLWGARGTGKSSIVKAMHALINMENPSSLTLVEIHREDIPTLPVLLKILQDSGRKTVLFCDDLSFDLQDESYKSLKAVLDGGIEGRPANVIFYATSNRRHLMARDMIENERSTAINPSEAVEEKVSLSDRFGLWLGFHNISQDVYFEIIAGYAKEYDLDIAEDELFARAKEWTVTRGSRSGRVAWQFIQEIAGEQGKHIA
ncbi:ATP-binding protein [Thalassospira marina]|uniref:AAA family ATPase n=1 Tax=Thalassospira marina TaxID=2048283 RepID=A0A2N3KVF5_9PROT|nr:ATP-binding protein [Thalassospira marina]PKR54517.1 AAA family ATPase [Thalassospira marina]